MSKVLGKGEIALALGKVNDFINKIEKGLDDLDITTEAIDQALATLRNVIEKEINSLSTRSS
jgi:hypothetical protein